MFNWICPECGREVPPSATECRFCAERKKAAEIAAPPVAAPPPYGAPPYGTPPVPQPLPYAQQQPLPQQTLSQQPMPHQPDAQYAQPYAPPQPQQPYYAPPPPHMAQQPPQQQYYAPPGAAAGYPPAKPGLPTWALSLLFALAFIGVGAAIFFGYQYMGRGPRAERAGLTEPSAEARTKPSSPVQKYIEVVGFRLMQDARHHPQARFVVVNHSSTELADLTANVTLYASTSRSEEDAVGTFSFKLPTIAANESQEMTVPLTTKLKVYELPDWQKTQADVQLTQP